MKNGDQPINPTERPISGGGTLQTFGLTKREYFAALAMQGYMANKYTPHHNPEYIADYAVECAEALLSELEKE